MMPASGSVVWYRCGTALKAPIELERLYRVAVTLFQ